MDYFLLAQFVGLISLSLEIFRFQCKSPKVFFYIEPFLSILYFLQFALLGASGAYLVSALSITRGFAGLFLNQKNMRQIIVMFYIPAYITIGLIVASSFFEFLPTIALLVSSMTFLCRDNRWLVTRLYIVNNAIWLIYAVPYDAYAHMATCVLTLTSLVIGIIRYEKVFTRIKTYALNYSYKKISVKNPI